ncbi:MAG: prolipoprotein diacylglyceryl transferase, partial [Clostridiales bacterium]|nr:prolipoprotein diacylglyceryl transferase [Clostridiales bacterium]
MVEFPGLGGIQLSISREAIRNLFGIEGFSIYWYGIIIALGFLLAVLLAMKNSKRFGLEPDNILDMIIFAAPMAIIGARLYYVIFSWDLFRDNPIDILNTRKGGLAIYGGVIFGILTAYVFCKIKKIKPLKLIDFGVPYLVMAQGIGRWGNFFNQEAFGVQTNLPWRMNGDVINQYLLGVNPSIDLSLFGVHPTFLYESIWDIAVFIFLLWFR